MLTGAAFRHFWGIPPQKRQLGAWQPTADSVAFQGSLFRYFPATTATRAPLLSPVSSTSSPVSFSFPSLPPCVCYGVYHTAFVLCKASVSAKFACCDAVGILHSGRGRRRRGGFAFGQAFSLPPLRRRTSPWPHAHNCFIHTKLPSHLCSEVPNFYYF